MPDFYGTATGFITYHTERSNALDPDDDNATIEASLLVASEWVDGRYRARFMGYKTDGRDQMREWPRNGHQDRYGYAIGSSSVPHEIEFATYEMALRHLATPDVLSVDYTPSKYDSVSVDGAVAAKFAKFGSVHEIQVQFKNVGDILGNLFSEENSSSSLSGSVKRT